MVKEGAARILIVDDDNTLRFLLSKALSPLGRVDLAETGQEAREKVKTQDYSVILLDYMLPDTDGITLLKEFKEIQPASELVVLTNVREVKLAVQSMKLGAYDYLSKKDMEVEELKALLLRIFDKQKKTKEILYLRSEIERLTEQEFILGNTPAMLAIKEVMDRAAQTPATVLIQGESGTGKELVARYLHEKSPRATRPFVAINMTSIPENLMESALFGHEKGAFTGAIKTNLGKFELADGGTLFCDEIGDLKLDVQSKLLRTIQENEIERVGGQRTISVDVRLITATKNDLKKMVEAGTFREDLYYRLNVIPVRLPPLRDRLGDIPSFVELFVNRYNRRFGRNVAFTHEAVTMLGQYPWPGNIRELEHLVERLVAVHPADTIDVQDIPLDYQYPGLTQLGMEAAKTDQLRNAIDAFERGFILRALEKENWHQENTARRLGIHRKTLEYKIKKLNLISLIEENRRLPKEEPSTEASTSFLLANSEKAQPTR